MSTRCAAGTSRDQMVGIQEIEESQARRLRASGASSGGSAAAMTRSMSQQRLARVLAPPPSPPAVRRHLTTNLGSATSAAEKRPTRSASTRSLSSSSRKLTNTALPARLTAIGPKVQAGGASAKVQCASGSTSARGRPGAPGRSPRHMPQACASKRQLMVDGLGSSVNLASAKTAGGESEGDAREGGERVDWLREQNHRLLSMVVQQQQQTLAQHQASIEQLHGKCDQILCALNVDLSSLLAPSRGDSQSAPAAAHVDRRGAVSATSEEHRTVYLPAQLHRDSETTQTGDSSWQSTEEGGQSPETVEDDDVTAHASPRRPSGDGSDQTDTSEIWDCNRGLNTPHTPLIPDALARMQTFHQQQQQGLL